MKKRTLLAASACVFMFASVMMSCGGSQEQKPATDSTKTSEVTTPATEGTTANASTTTPANVYACEMKCEGEGKTYTETGKCPKCGMELKQTTTTTTTETTTK